jgi:glycosyltransferase involved in cell wall biosynthesis
MSTESITLLLANYNNGQYLRECLDSVLAQTSARWQCIVLDDASTDDSREVYAEYGDEPRIRIEHNPENLGYIGTLQRLIAKAETDIVGLLDPDDALSEEAVETILAAYEANPEAGFVYSNFWYCDAKLQPLRHGFCHPIPPSRSSLDMDCVSHFKTFRKRVYEETTGYDAAILYAEDKDLVLKMEEAAPLVHVEGLLYLYRLLPSSQSHGAKRKVGKRSYARARRLARRRRTERGLPMSLRQRVLGWLDGILHPG